MIAALAVGAHGQSRLFVDDGADSTFDLGRALSASFDGSASGDVNGDGFVDLVYSQFTTNSLNPTLTVALNDGSGRFIRCAPAQCPATPTKQRYANLLLVDFDGDRDLDLVHIDALKGSVVFWANDGKGGFTTPKNLRLPALGNYKCATIHAADLDRDGDADLVIGGSFQDADRVWHNAGQWTFVHAHTLPGPKNHLAGVSAADANNDGFLDILTTYRTGPTQLWLGSKTGGYKVAAQLTATVPAGAWMADLDGDKVVEIILQDADKFRSRLFKHYPVGGYRELPSLPNFYPLRCDWDGDGDLDLFGVIPLRNDGGLAFTDVSKTLFSPYPARVRQMYQPTFVDIDGDRDEEFLAMTLEHSGLWPQNWAWASPMVFRNQTRHLEATATVRLQQTIQVRALADHGHTMHLALSARLAKPPVPQLGLLRIDPTAMVLLPKQTSNQRGPMRWSIVVPNDTALIGWTAYWQGLDVPPTAAKRPFFTGLSRTAIQR